MTNGSRRGGSVVYLSAYTSIGSSPPWEDDPLDPEQSRRLELGEIHARGQRVPIIGTAVPHQPWVTDPPPAASGAAAITARGQNAQEIRAGNEAAHTIPAQVQDIELHIAGESKVEPQARRVPPRGRERVREILIEQGGRGHTQIYDEKRSLASNDAGIGSGMHDAQPAI